MPDVSGTWTFQLSPDADAGVTIPNSDVIHADLEQVQPTGVLSLARLLYGTLVSDDKTFFDTLEIPRLMQNSGSKTGSMLGCKLTINIPVDMPVVDDDNPPSALRLSLTGLIEQPGSITGDPTLSSLLLLSDDPMTHPPRSFSWSATRP
jgi:hypothetical protein